MLAEYLGPEGFAAQTAGTGPLGLEHLAREAPDLVVLDVMLPELSGFEALRRIRTTSRVPVIMLTARGEEVDRVVGLELGADDYLAKPFSPRELVARIRAVLRRAPGEAPTGSVLQWGPLRLDLRARRANVGDQDLELTSAELRILELSRSPSAIADRVFRRRICSSSSSPSIGSRARANIVAAVARAWDLQLRHARLRCTPAASRRATSPAAGWRS